ncbi:Uncharacterised protein [Legionella steigerwaltii]|uniref:Uncharacterized protein n=1 Tax=Legionella steigerwaltii TaxID=460 RepID=A0A378L7C7_9GAMM|nr:hypothetical protein [Legionella steigerwaltii]KTD69939.1 hypothetical protein Lstg_3380 [Legionella steigerwaltii]STY21748.1 Uncharacterised protein [Legionella steigerwaltii]
MYRFIKKLLSCVLVLISTSVFSAPLEINLDPNKPVLLTNTNKQTLSLLCEVHAVASVKNYISIQVVSGKGMFNGTTLKQGDSLVSALTNLQQIPISADPGAKAHVTNLGTQPVKAICN